MYNELIKRLREDKSWVEQGTTGTEHTMRRDRLSEIREQGGKKYRHCYSCHFEFGDGKW